MTTYTVKIIAPPKSLDASGRMEFVCRINRLSTTIINPWNWTGLPTDFINAATIVCSDYERQVVASTPYVDAATFTINV